MQLEAGKFYKTRDGRKVGPMERHVNQSFPWTAGDDRTWYPDGTRYIGARKPSDDIIALWHDGPVREITRKEIVPGVYGVVKVGDWGNPRGKVDFELGVISVEDRLAISLSETHFSKAELTAAIATLTTIRDALAEVA